MEMDVQILIYRQQLSEQGFWPSNGGSLALAGRPD
jgi:hypothetical protein